MKSCNCEHTYRTLFTRQLVCANCGAPCPEDTEKKLSGNHIKLNENQLKDLGKDVQF